MLCFVSKFLILIISIFFVFRVIGQTAEKYEKNIIFYTINSKGDWMKSNFNNNDTLLAHCNASENWSMIIHGWRESVNSTWPKAMIGNFSQARGGCVFFMDYS